MQWTIVNPLVSNRVRPKPVSYTIDHFYVLVHITHIYTYHTNDKDMCSYKSYQWIENAFYIGKYNPFAFAGSLAIPFACVSIEFWHYPDWLQGWLFLDRYGWEEGWYYFWAFTSFISLHSFNPIFRYVSVCECLRVYSVYI